jgi:hypothetical protein
MTKDLVKRKPVRGETWEGSYESALKVQIMACVDGYVVARYKDYQPSVRSIDEFMRHFTYSEPSR